MVQSYEDCVNTFVPACTLFAFIIVLFGFNYDPNIVLQFLTEHTVIDAIR